MNPSQQIVKIEKLNYNEEGIDCTNPFFTFILTRIKEPAISQVKKSFVDSISGNLIVLSDKIYFYAIDSFMSKKVSSDINIENYKKGNSLAQSTRMSQGKDSFESNPKSPGEFEAKSFDLMENYQNLVSEKQFVGTLYRTSTLNSEKNSKDPSPYHLFFMGDYMIIINLDKGLNKNFNMGILANKYNRFTVCRIIY